MSHEIETMAYAHEVPWHGLGARVNPNSTPDEMLTASGLDWDILRLPIFTEIEGKQIRIPGRRVMVRSSDRKVMTIAGQDWKPLQNRELLEFFRDYTEAGGASLETAGSLRGGSVVWALANLNHSFKVGGNDQVNGYLLFTSPHRVGAAISIRTTTVRVVCANTMALAMSEKGGVNYSQNHLTEFNSAAAKMAVEAAHETLSLAAKRAETLHRLKLSLADRLKVVGQFFSPASTADQLFDLTRYGKDNPVMLINNSIENGPGAEPDTAWGLLQGVIHYADHVTGRTAASRMFRSWVGDLSRTKLDVEAKLLEMAA